MTGEYIRTNINDNEAGVPLLIDTQVLDIETCDPVPDIFVEIWHCNSTGVYSGIVAQGNGVGPADPSNLDATFHRGVQQTDSAGVVGFETRFPGHYTGRTHHIHVMVHTSAEAQPNGTLIDTTASHVGQMYFDQDLNNEVEALAPYSTNTQPLTLNKDDFILEEQAETSDPFMSYVRLGDNIEDGILAWISLGVDTTNTRTVHNAAMLSEDGGISNDESCTGDFCGPPPQ